MSAGLPPRGDERSLLALSSVKPEMKVVETDRLLPGQRTWGRRVSSVGALSDQLPRYAVFPPIEAVVYGWGVSEDGQLGVESPEDVLYPKVVESLLGTRFMGRELGRAGIVAGSRGTLAIDAQGHLWAWGWNERGTLGIGHRMSQRNPTKLAALESKRIVQAALGGWHGLAVDIDGQVYSWGGNEYFQCGVDAQKRDIVQPTPCLPQLRVQQVACGGMHSVALTTTGEVWQWGEPWGDFSIEIHREARQIECPEPIAHITSGAFHNLALTTSGNVYAWGTNEYGQLGNDSTRHSTSMVRVEGLLEGGVADIAAGGWHSLALTAAGEVYTWGRGEHGRLGVGDKKGTSKLRPTKVKGLDGHRIVQASCGGTHTLLLDTDGRIFTFGRNTFGRLGIGKSQSKEFISAVEIELPGGHARWKVVTVACGGRHSLCLACPVHSITQHYRHDADMVLMPSTLGSSSALGGSSSMLEALSSGAGGSPASERKMRESSDDGGLADVSGRSMSSDLLGPAETPAKDGAGLILTTSAPHITSASKGSPGLDPDAWPRRPVAAESPVEPPSAGIPIRAGARAEQLQDEEGEPANREPSLSVPSPVSEALMAKTGLAHASPHAAAEERQAESRASSERTEEEGSVSSTTDPPEDGTSDGDVPTAASDDGADGAAQRVADAADDERASHDSTPRGIPPPHALSAAAPEFTPTMPVDVPVALPRRGSSSRSLAAQLEAAAADPSQTNS